MKNKGITLVALIVTIIVLLILSGTVLSLVIVQGGIINLAEQAAKNQIESQENEKKELEELYNSIWISTNDNSQVTISIEELSDLIDTKVEEKIKNINVETVPTGTVISCMGNNIQEGYLSCNGAIYNISDYTDLAEQIKTDFGSYNYFGGDGTATFGVPDLRGEFLRGTGTATRNTGTGASVGVHQDATTHTYLTTTSGGKLQVYFKGKGILANHDRTVNNSTSNLTGYRQDIDTSYTSSVKFEGYTSRPTNTSVLYCIKY